MAHARSSALAGGAILLAALLAACDVTTGPANTPRPESSAAGASTAPVSGAAAEPSPRPTARPGIRASAVGAVPSQFRYVAIDTLIADGYHTRLWLIDLSSRRAPALAAEWDAPASPVGGWSASADGRIVIVSASGTRSRVALSALRPETGETRILFEDPALVVISPRISPDGSRFAFTKYPATGGNDLGIWAGRPTGGDLERITEPSSASNVPQMPLAWSPDGAWLAFTRDLDVTEIRLVRADGGDERRAGAGERVAWRTAAPELAVEQTVGTGSRIYTVDLVTGRTTDLLKEDKGSVAALAWHPSGDRLMYVLSEGASREASLGIWLWRADLARPIRADAGRTVFAPEWSADGSVLSALAGGDDARIPIVDLLTGRQLSVLCRRGGTPPADCL